MTNLIDVIRPTKPQTATALNVSSVLIGSLLLALSAQIAMPLPFTPVPVSMQSLAVLLLGGMLGYKRASLAVMLYLLEGAIGLPVFANGGYGIAKLIGPTAGYCWGFVFAAFVVGYISEKNSQKSVATTFFAMTLGTVIILFCGAIWLSLSIGLEHSLNLAVYPFLLGDLAKIFFATAIIPGSWKMIRLFHKE